MSTGFATAHEAGSKSSLSACTASLRVLTLTPFYPSTENTSQGGFVAEVLPYTSRLGIENEVVAVTPFYRGRVQAAGSEIPSAWKSYFSLPGNVGLPPSGAFLAASFGRSIRDAHVKKPFDLIHAHAALPCGHAAETLSRELGIPFVVSVHGLDVFFEQQAGKMLGNLCRRACQRVYRRARSVVCISRKVCGRLSGAGINTRVVYNGVDEQMFSPEGEQKCPLIVLSVGNLIAIKGHAALLRAFAQVLRVVPDCELEIIGDGPERQVLARLAADLGITARVRFLGRQDRIAVATAMKRCAVFALPSFYEGLGCVYLEAMACGKPVIGCEGQGIDEIIEHGKNGLLVPPQSEARLKHALRMLLENQDFRRRIGGEARRTIVEGHTLAHQAKQLSELYREVVA